MRWPLLIGVVLLSGCEPAVRDTFTVDVADGAAASAVLSICGEQTPMRRSGSRFEASYPIRCEGEGDVIVRYADGASTACHVGYVTTGAGQDWRFAVRNRTCEPVDLPGRS